MFILSKTFDDDTSGIEVNDNGDKYRFQIDGDTAVYVGEDAVPQSVEDEIKNQGYASSVTYDVPGSVKEYVDANAGGGTATETKVPSNATSGYHEYVDEDGDVRFVSETYDSYKGIEHIAGEVSGEPAFNTKVQIRGPNATNHLVRFALNGSGGATKFQVGVASAVLEALGPQGDFSLKSFNISLEGNSVVKHDPQDVTAISSPSKGMVAYNDGSTGTEGPAFYDGSAWKSLVDGSTI